jgi:hypothetical protein
MMSRLDGPVRVAFTSIGKPLFPEYVVMKIAGESA